MDLYSRRLIGWAMSDRMKRDVVLEAQRMALLLRGPVEGLVQHTDRGSQYASIEYQALLRVHGVNASMSGVGNCYDNAAMESFFHTLKVELIHQRRYRTREEARQEIFERGPVPMLTFVQEEVTLRRPIGGRMVLRRQLQRLVEVGQLRHVEIQVMPTNREDHAGMAGELRVLKLNDGTAVGYSEAQLTSRLIAAPREVQILEMRYGIIRAQALTPRESLAFIEKLLGET